MSFNQFTATVLQIPLTRIYWVWVSYQNQPVINALFLIVRNFLLSFHLVFHTRVSLLFSLLSICHAWPWFAHLSKFTCLSVKIHSHFVNNTKKELLNFEHHFWCFSFSAFRGPSDSWYLPYVLTVTHVCTQPWFLAFLNFLFSLPPPPPPILK